jgi:hypothetical protein
MTFSICDEKPSDKNPGQQVTLSIPHGRAVLLNRYVSATLQYSPLCIISNKLSIIDMFQVTHPTVRYGIVSTTVQAQ